MSGGEAPTPPSGEPPTPLPLPNQGSGGGTCGGVGLGSAERPAADAPHPSPSPRRRFTRRRLALAVSAAAAFGVWYFALRTPEPKDDLSRFQGQWQLAVPAAGRDNRPTARVVPGVTIRVTGDRWVYLDNGKEQKRYAVALRPEANPKEIDLVMLGPNDEPTAFVIRGVYAIDRDRAKVAHAPNPDPRPATADETDPGFNGSVWLLERVP